MQAERFADTQQRVELQRAVEVVRREGGVADVSDHAYDPFIQQVAGSRLQVAGFRSQAPGFILHLVAWSLQLVACSLSLVARSIIHNPSCSNRWLPSGQGARS